MCCVELGAHIQHSLFRLKITVTCLTSTYPSIHFSLDEDTVEITVGCLVCCGGVCCCVVVVRVCVVCGEAWHTHSLSLALSPSSSFSLSFSLLTFFFFLCLFSFSFSFALTLALALVLVLYLSFFFLPFYSLFSSLPFTPTNTARSTDQQTRRQTSRHSNVIWRRARAQQLVLSLLFSPPSSLLSRVLLKKIGTFLLQEYFRRGIYFYYSFK